MRQRSRYTIWSVTLFLLSFLLLSVVACGSDSTGDATPELVVVVFETEEPTVAPTKPKNTPTSISSPTTKATVVSSNAVAEAAASSDAQVEEVSQPARRPSDENPLTGLKADDPAVLRRRPIMVRVGNDPGARPQVALNEADLVYEEVVEWWVTRFTAIYLSQDPEMIAPIRSARLINLHLTPQYQGALANSGGSDQVRWELSQSDMVNLDEFYSPQPYFYRENEGWQTRLAFNAAVAREYMANNDLEADVKLRGFTFSPKIDLKDFPQEAVGEAEVVIVPYPRQTSQTTWEYDPISGKYLRFTSGEPMMDFAGNQITASNVIIYFTEHQETDIVEDSNGATSIRIVATGFGTAWIGRDGKILKGNWETNGRETPKFFFNDGQPIPLKPGNSWVEVVPLEYLIEIDGVNHARIGGPVTDESETGELSDEPATATPTATSTPIGFRATRTPTVEATPANE